MRFNCAIFIFLFSIAIQTQVYSQVGMGTTNPDPSAILDITSSDKGFLAPRMDTADRLAIVSPAEGLMVFDTELKTYCVFNDASWAQLSEGRVNYKLIQSDLDLAEELTAGGGTNYLLDTDTYYEINGTVVLAAPIDLNDAYVSGLDANEDILVRVGGTIFSGSSGGSVRNLTLTAPGGSIFALTGTGVETLVFQNAIVANSGSIGSISTFGVVFKNIIQLVNNTTGVTYTNIGNVLLSNVAWFGSNTGTYETYVGTFDLIEKISGFCKVPAGVTGIDVSSNPTVTAGNIISTSFSGLGTHVNGYTTGTYTGYKFSNTWNVDSPGLKVENDNSAAADFYYTGSLTTGFSQSITAAPAEIQGSGTFNSNNLFRFTAPVGQGNNRLVYDGIETRQFQVNASLSVRVVNALGDFFALVLYKNGLVVTESNALLYIDSSSGDSQIQNIAINSIVELSTGDYIEVYVNRLTGTGTDTFVVFSETLSIK